jgi:hypothetical protein
MKKSLWLLAMRFGISGKSMRMKSLFHFNRWTSRLAVFGAALAAGNVPAAPERPNVLFVICDDLNDSVEGMGGHPQARTPNLDRLMKSAVRFDNAHANAPMCGPSRAGLLSGLYPHHNGYYGWAQNLKKRGGAG